MALLSFDSKDNGRDRMPELGRLCCQDKVFARDGIAALGDALLGLLGLSKGVDVPEPANGVVGRLRTESLRRGSRMGEAGVAAAGGGVSLAGVWRSSDDLYDRGERGVFSGDSERSLSVEQHTWLAR